MFEKDIKAKRNIILIGEAGSGKTEMSIFFVKLLAGSSDKSINLIDMDQTKGMFRSRDISKYISEDISLVAPYHFMDMPLVPGGMEKLMTSENNINVIDVGGGIAGAVAIGQYSKYMNSDDSIVLYLINPYRGFSTSSDDIKSMMEDIKRVSHIDEVVVISNPNFGKKTSAEDVLNGHRNLEKMLSDIGMKAQALVIPTWIDESVFENEDIQVFSITPYIQYP